MQQFFTKSEQVHNIIKGFNLTKTLFVSSIIIGEEHIGKKLFVKHLFPDAPVVSGEDQGAVVDALRKYDELIITDFEKLRNQESLELDNKRIIATASYIGNQTIIDDMFAFIYTMPSLKERPEDVEYIKALFIKEAASDLMLTDTNFDITTIPVNLTQNTKSLKSTIYRYLMIHSMSKNEIQDAVYSYVSEKLEGNNGYKEHLALYEKPLIEAGLKKFGSQLQLSQILGINRNTLRKKIHEHHID